MGVVDETEFARRALGRKILTEDQLREARTFAGGGRSLLAVLLDLGYLKPQDLADLHDPASPLPRTPRKSRTLFWGFALGALTATAVALLIPTPPRTRTVTRTVELPAAAPDLRGHLVAAAEERLGRAHELQRAGEYGPRAEQELRTAQALAEEVLAGAPRHLRARCALARALEMMGDWGPARDVYRDVLKDESRYGPALAGLARVLLYQGSIDEALAQAEKACSNAPSGEAFLARAEVRKARRDREGSEKDLAEAVRREPRLAADARKLLLSLHELR
jgi:tetratricopeptide (TPR) repeat protein